MTHLHARAAQLYIFQQTKPFNISIDKAPTDKKQRCSSSQRRRMFLGQNFIVSVFVLNTSLGTRFLVPGEICSWWQWFHRQVYTSGWVTSIAPWYVLQNRWTRENCPLPIWLIGRSTNLTTSAEVQRGLSFHVWALSSHLLTASAHQLAHCS